MTDNIELAVTRYYGDSKPNNGLEVDGLPGSAQIGTELDAELDRLTAILNDSPVENAGKPERRKFIDAHRLLTDLRDVYGGSPEQRAAVLRKLNEA